MFSSLLQKPRISVTLQQDSVFVHPRVSTSECWSDDLPSPDPLVSGTVMITLPAPKAIQKIKVKLEGLCDAYGGDGERYENSITLQKEVSIDLHGEVFEAGNQFFNFEFIIPSKTAVYQRCTYGRVRHFVKATCIFAGSFSGSITTPPVALFISANPAQPGELPLPTNLDIQYIAEELGVSQCVSSSTIVLPVPDPVCITSLQPVGVQIYSPHLSVASLMSLRVAIPSPPGLVQIEAINTFIRQSYEVEYQDGKIAAPSPQRFLLDKVSMKASPSLAVPICTAECGSENPESCSDHGTEPAQRYLKTPLARRYPEDIGYVPCCPPKKDVPEIDPDPLKMIGEGEELVYQRMFRLPTDDKLRATTFDGSSNLIRVSHAIVLEIRYRPADAPEGSPSKLFTLTKKIEVFSCCVLLDSLYLPIYSKSKPQTVIKPLKDTCLCNMSIEAMMCRDGELLQRATSLEEPTGDARSIGSDRSTKSPSYSDSPYALASNPFPAPPADD